MSIQWRALVIVAVVVLGQINGDAQTNEVQVSKQVTASDLGTAVVFPFEGSGGVVLSDLIAHELLQRGATLVDRTKVVATLRQRDLTIEDVVGGRADASVLSEVLKIDTFITGSVRPIVVYMSGADSGRVSVASFRVVDVRSGRILSSVSFNSNTEVLLKGKTYGTAAGMMVGRLLRK